MNRKQHYSSTDRTNIQYKITIIPITKDLQKEEQKFQLTPSNYLPIIKEINFAKKVSQKNNTEDLLCGNVFNIGLMKDSSTSLTKENVKQTDFLFLDFEKPKKGSTKKVLTFARCLEILENNNLNHILKTSYNHTEENPRLHLFLPLLKPIKTDYEYKFNLQLVQEKYFSEYEFDNSTKNISRFTFSSKSDTLKYSFCFDKDDIHTEKPIDEIIEISKKLSQSQTTVEINDTHLNNFNKQVFSMYRFKPAGVNSNGVAKFYRDEKDKTPNVWYSTEYYNNTNGYTIMDKKTQYSVLFSYNDFKNSINPKLERESIQSILSKELNDWFIDGGKKYVITNEGLGKSSTILKFAQNHNFIFACHTKERVLEVCNQLKENGIKYKRILSNYQILKIFKLNELAEEYDSKVQKNKKLSFKKFINDKEKDTSLAKLIIEFYEQNLKDLETDDCVRVVTSHKLKTQIAKEDYDGNNANHWYIEQRIVFDEFNFNEWALFRVPENGEYVEQLETKWNTINNETKYISLVKNSSFLNVLKYCERVLVLTTERNLIKPLFHNTDFKEIRVFENKVDSNFRLNEYKFEKQLFDCDITYICVKSTRLKIRDELIQGVKNFFSSEIKNIKVICDNSLNTDNSHIAVKGSNKLVNENLLIIGTLRTEIEDNIFYYSCEEYFKKYENHMNDLGNNVKKEVQNFIVQAHLSTQVSQSIGRNSGFRRTDKKTIVVLPLLQGNSKHNFKPFPLNYVSPNVKILPELVAEKVAD